MPVSFTFRFVLYWSQPAGSTNLTVSKAILLSGNCPRLHCYCKITHFCTLWQQSPCNSSLSCSRKVGKLQSENDKPLSREGNFLRRLPKTRINFHRGLIITARHTIFSTENSPHFIKTTMATTNKTKGGRERRKSKMKLKENWNRKPTLKNLLIWLSLWKEKKLGSSAALTRHRTLQQL